MSLVRFSKSSISRILRSKSCVCRYFAIVFAVVFVAVLVYQAIFFVFRHFIVWLIYYRVSYQNRTIAR